MPPTLHALCTGLYTVYTVWSYQLRTQCVYAHARAGARTRTSFHNKRIIQQLCALLIRKKWYDHLYTHASEMHNSCALYCCWCYEQPSGSGAQPTKSDDLRRARRDYERTVRLLLLGEAPRAHTRRDCTRVQASPKPAKVR